MERTIARQIPPALATVLGVIVIAASWQALPETVPIHFGLTGLPDGWGPKWTLATLPVLSVVLLALLTVGEFQDKFNIPWKVTAANKTALVELCQRLLWMMKTFTVTSLAYLQWAAVAVAMKRADGIGVWFAPVFLGGMGLILAWFCFRGSQIAGSSTSQGA